MTRKELKEYNDLVSKYNELYKENKELKKQLEKKYKKIGTLTGELLYEENTKLINQQKEFIEYLEDEIENSTFLKPSLEMILQKYKGDDK